MEINEFMALFLALYEKEQHRDALDRSWEVTNILLPDNYVEIFDELLNNKVSHFMYMFSSLDDHTKADSSKIIGALQEFQKRYVDGCVFLCTEEKVGFHVILKQGRLQHIINSYYMSEEKKMLLQEVQKIVSAFLRSSSCHKGKEKVLTRPMNFISSF